MYTMYSDHIHPSQATPLRLYSQLPLLFLYNVYRVSPVCAGGVRTLGTSMEHGQTTLGLLNSLNLQELRQFQTKFFINGNQNFEKLRSGHFPNVSVTGI